MNTIRQRVSTAFSGFVSRVALGATLLSLALVGCSDSSKSQSPIPSALAFTGGCVTVDVIATNAWTGGFNGAVRIANNNLTAKISSFEIKFTMGGTVSGSAWNGSIASASGTYTATNPNWLQYSPVAIGSSWDVGFSGSGSIGTVAISSVKINGTAITSGVACGGSSGGGGTTDTTAPTVSLASSASSVTAAGSVTLTATAADAVGVTKVEFYDGSTLLASDTSSPYSSAVSFAQTSTAQTGTKSYTAKAYDAAGNVATSSAVSVTVNIPATSTTDTTAPTVSLASSASSVTAAGSVTLTATASDNVGVAKVEFYDGTTLLVSDSTSPFSTSVALTSANNGSKSYTAKAFDAAGNTTTSTAVSVTVNIATTTTDTTAPTVSLASSASSVTAAGSVTLSATASDNVGVAKVEFYDGTTLLTTDTSSPYTSAVSFTQTSTAQTGTRSYTAKAYDAAGNVTTSSAVSITLNIPASTGTGGTTATSTNLCARTMTAPTNAAVGSTSSGKFNYGEALQKSILFYEAQQAGPLPSWNRVSWRADAAMNDAVKGGWFDAGDHVKFGFPMSYSATVLAWGAIEYKSGYQAVGQLDHIRNNLRFVADYFVAAHTAPNELVGQIGGGSLDHAWWGPVEVMQMERPSYSISTSKPGSDLAGQTAAALASIAIVFKGVDDAYAATLLSHAKQLFSFAENYRGKYSSSITDAQGYYQSSSGDPDELAWASVWLYKATNDSAYLAKARSYYDNLNKQGQENYRSYKWTLSWDDVSYGVYVLMAQLTGEQKYKDDAEHWLDWWTVGFNGSQVKYVGDLAWLDQWGSLRYAANTALPAFIYSDLITDATKKARYHDFAVKQINYMLGSNPNNRSYVVGFGVNPPKNPHHRTAHASWQDALDSSKDPVDNRHIIYGALVGGPGSDGSYTDTRSNYQTNEIATDYNAAFTGGLAKMVQEFGGKSLASFPAIEKPDMPEFQMAAKINATGPKFIELSVWAQNRSAFPACMTQDVSLRYFFDLSEVFSAGYGLSDLVSTVRGGTPAPTISSITQWSGNIYYVDVTIPGKIYPGGQQWFTKEVQFRLGLNDQLNNVPTNAFDPTNDPSFKDLVGTTTNGSLIPTKYIPYFDKGILLYGEQPVK